MSTKNTYNESNEIKTVQGRWMTIDENIYDCLDIYTYSLYTAIRYEGDYSQQTSKVTKSISFLCDKAKISRRQCFKSLNILESFGLISRENHKRLGEVGLIWVSKQLHYFTPVHTVHTPVHTVHTPVHGVHTYQESFQESSQNNINTREDEKSDWENHSATYELARTDQAKEIALSISESEKSFAAFWSMYPVKKGERRAKAAWLSQGCHRIANDILKKLELQLKKDSQYLDGYATNPDKYIMEEKWKDEIQIRKKGKGLDHYDRESTDWGKDFYREIF